MKAISIIEPWASLIKEGYKHIETRSWQTEYRGELYIHASKTKLTKREREKHGELFELLGDTDFGHGHLIAKCNLVDCRLITDDLIKEVKKNPKEFISGFYTVGRYAWVLEDIEVLETPIPIRGRLGLWAFEEAKAVA